MLIHPGFVPHLNGKPFFEKPPLYYWAMAGAYRVAGVSQGVARSVSSVFGLSTLVLIFFWVKRDASKEAAYMAVFILATCVQFFQSTHWVLLDPTLMFWLVVAAWGAWTAMSRGSGWPALLAFYGGMCMAVWTKGLVGCRPPGGRAPPLPHPPATRSGPGAHSSPFWEGASPACSSACASGRSIGPRDGTPSTSSSG